MHLYDFLEKFVDRGARVEDVFFLNSDPMITESTFEHLEQLIREYSEKSPSERRVYYGTRRFGFDKGSYIGSIEVCRVLSKKVRLVGGQIYVLLNKPVEGWGGI